MELCVDIRYEMPRRAVAARANVRCSLCCRPG